MITLPDFKEKQLLFIKTERGVSNKIKFQNDNIVYMKDDAVINRASCHKVFAVFVVGDITITSELMKQAAAYGVSFFFLKPNMEVYTSINAAAEGNYLLRQVQYAMSPERELDIARRIVQNKIGNQARLLRSIDKKQEAGDIEMLGSSVPSVTSADTLRGIEGNASRIFFGAYFDEVGWVRRSPRAKPDVTNFLLDIGYTILFNCADSLLRLYGFDTYKGCYHKLFFQRQSLACDIVEPFRCIIDRQVRKSHNLGQIDAKDFKVSGGKVVAVDFEKSAKYATLFMGTIMENKEDLYLFVQGFYRHMMNPAKNPFPEFIVR
jgi:CRISPR-associated protein Cas1